MLLIDITTAQAIVTLAAGALAVLGIVFGWFGKAWRWVRSLTRRPTSPGTVHIPKRTLILNPPQNPNALWWHLGSVRSQPAMQVVGALKATNIANCDVLTMAARLRRPKTAGHAMVEDPRTGTYGSEHPIRRGCVGDVAIHFWVQPPVREKGKPFRADVAIVDQFGNKHWLKGLEFLYH